MRHRDLLILCLVLISWFRILAAEPADKEPFEMAKAIQPRFEGASWLYTSKLYEGDQWSPAGSSREDVQAVIEIDGVKCYKVQLTVDWRGIMDRLAGEQLTEDAYSYYWEYANEQGSYNYSGGDTIEIQYPAPTSLDQFELTLPYPVKKGHKYIAEDSNYEVIETEAKVKVPAGEFVCTVYQALYVDDPDYISRQRLYMSVGVGLVRWEEYERIEGVWKLTYQDDLVEYDFNLPADEADERETGNEPIVTVDSKL